MKLAVITNYWIGSDGGGVREYTKNLVSHLKQENVDEPGALTDLALPAGRFFFADNHRDDRAPEKSPNAIRGDATQEPAAPKQSKAACLAPGIDCNRGKQGARKEGHHCRNHREQHKHEHAEERCLRDHALGPENDCFCLVVQRI